MDVAAVLERPAVRWSVLALAGLVVVHLVAWLALVALQQAHADAVLSGVEVDAVDVSGLNRDGLEAAIDDRAEERFAQTVRVTAVADDATDDAATDDASAEDQTPHTADAPQVEEELETDRAAIGMTVDTAATADDAWRRGRRGLWRALGDQLAARAGRTLHVPLHLEIDERHLDEWSREAAAELSVPARDGDIELRGDPDDDTVEVEVTDARPGTEVDADDLRERVRRHLTAELGPVHVEVAAARVVPDITAADVDAALPDAERAVSAPVELVNPSPEGTDLVLGPAELAAVLEVAADPDADEGERLRVHTDAGRLTDHLDDDTLDELAPEPVDAAIDLEDGEVVVTDGADGVDLDLDATAELVVELALRDNDRSGELPGETTSPDVTTADAEGAADDAAILVSAPVMLTNPSAGEDLELSPSHLSTILDVEVVVGDDGAALDVTASADALAEVLGDDGVAELENPPVQLEVELVGEDELSVEGGTPGFSLDLDGAAARAAELARSDDDRTAELPGATDDPEMTADELEDLGVTEIVSSFTTSLVPGQPRNTNIHLAADYLDGSMIYPGETFSLNQGIGQRTADRGFVENGFIEDGELISVTGGGVSQMGTTFMNAAWFAGVALLDFTPHSLYFQRYPMGREATLSWGVLDVVVENDSPHAIMVLTSHTDSRVTVAFASTPWADVDTWTGEPYDVVPGDVRDGFTVDFGRDITYPDGETTSESYSHTYQPEDEPEDD